MAQVHAHHRHSPKSGRRIVAIVAGARSRVGQLATRTGAPATAEYQQAQDQLGGALSLTATQSFRDLQAQLEGTENRITVERMRYNDAARAFNTSRARFPASLVVGLFGDRLRAKPYFSAQAGAAEVPKVEF